MNFIRFKLNENIKHGVIINENLYSFEDIFGKDIKLKDLINKFEQSSIEDIENKIKDIRAIDLEHIDLLSPFEEPLRNIICLGKNYLEHISECDTGGIDKNLGRPANPIYFSKMINRFVNPNGGIELHKNLTKQLDYEGELAVIIGKKCKNVEEKEVEDYIFGYSIINDISARDLQKQHSQWLRGKSLDNTTAFGPSILYKKGISFPPKLKIETRINKELRQENYTNNLIFSISHCISQLSIGTTLKPGDIIATGTPAGVGMGFNPPKMLKEDDIIEIKIEKIGKLINKVKRTKNIY